MANNKKVQKKSVAGVPGRSPVYPKVAVKLKGEEYNLVFNFNAIADAEALTGINMFGSFEFRSMNISTLRAMLWSALHTEHEDLTIEQAGDLLSVDNLSDVYAALIQCWAESAPETMKKVNGQNPPKA